MNYRQKFQQALARKDARDLAAATRYLLEVPETDQPSQLRDHCPGCGYKYRHDLFHHLRVCLGCARPLNVKEVP